MADRILFSIIIPTYNRSDLVMKALQSILGQRYNYFEVIVVDDGGTDNTGSLVASLHDDRIRYFQKENGERAAARNFGVTKAEGNFITYLDSDDLLKDDHLTVAYEYIMAHPEVSLFHIGYDVIKADGTLLYPWKPLPDPANEKLLEGNYFSCLGVFIRRELLASIKFNEDRDLTGSEDYEFWVRLAARYPFQAIGKSTACLVNHDERSVLTIDPLKFARRINLTKSYLKDDEQVNERFGSRLEMLFSYLDLYAALHLAMSGHKKLGRAALRSALSGHWQMIWNYRFWVAVKKLLS